MVNDFDRFRYIQVIAIRYYIPYTYRTHTFIGRISNFLSETIPCNVAAGLAPALETYARPRSHAPERIRLKLHQCDTKNIPGTLNLFKCPVGNWVIY